MSPPDPSQLHTALNHTHPLKVVLLGAPNVGKSTFANRLQSHYFRETYYPTHSATKILFDYLPGTTKAKALMDEYGGLQGKREISQLSGNGEGDMVVLSPVVFQSYNKYSDSVLENIRKSSKKAGFLRNEIYGYHYKPEDLRCPVPHYHAPELTAVSVEIIDTPAFRKDMIVPFLEVSLFRNLDKEDLRGLADEPRRPVSTKSLLVASGSGELDGKVDGYVFMYSAVPDSSSNPPSYEQAITPVPSAATNTSSLSEQTNDTSILKRRSSLPSSDQTDSFSVLEVMRTALYDAWQEYRSYQKKWKKGAEGDIYSLVYGLKQLWKMKNQEEQQRKLQELRQYSSNLESLNWDPANPESPPPIIIVCTHCDHPGASPLLVEAGKTLAGLWCCGFVQCDNETGQGVDEVLALMIRECIERKKLQQQGGSNSGHTRR
ncbi:hypothetical protein WICPIJ_005833 [Wickerhamomyces pijperi]|uniref:G domain-containing protein n=1 Tax=Wickerhamomyces pijperi TaxID=599730 RepID=A0A9P8Q2T2_WICPI|nr:hypothetical protein WICPIJ_005833 [Wickerhamomyces pijperi]